MSNIDFIHGFNKAVSTSNRLFAVYGNDVVDVDTGLGGSQNLISPELATMETFLDTAILQKYVDRPTSFDGTSWGVTNVGRAPAAKSIRAVKTRLYLGNCQLPDPDAPSNAGPWPSRVFKSDLPSESELRWGLEWGTNLTTVANNARVNISVGIQDFKFTNIKVGDPFYITSGLGSIWRSFVSSIDSRYQITLQDTVPSALAGNGHYWVGSNWFDVGTDDNDYIITLGENSDKLAIFKQFSLWVYNEVALQRINDAPGTTSRKSVVNIGPFTYYFHGSNTNNRRTGIYLFDGFKSTKISSAIQPYIDGMDTSNYSQVVGWREGNKLRMFLGDISNSQRNISLSKVAFTLDTDGGQWSVDPLADTITASGRFLEGGAEKWFIGTSDGEVMETPSGNDHDGVVIPFSVEIGFRYPAGSSVICSFPRIQMVARNGRGISVSYKLAGTPKKTDDVWHSLGDIEDDYQEFTLPSGHRRGRGINIKFSNIDGHVNNFCVQKLNLFFEPVNVRSRV